MRLIIVTRISRFGCGFTAHCVVSIQLRVIEQAKKKKFVPTFSLKLVGFLSEIVVCFCIKISFSLCLCVCFQEKKKKKRFGTAKVERPQKLRETLGNGLSTILFLIGRFIGRQNWQLWVLETSLFFTGRNEC